MKLANLVVKNEVGPQQNPTRTSSSFYEPLGVIAQEYHVASQLASSLVRFYVIEKVNDFTNPTV